MKKRLITLAFAAVITVATAAPAMAGISTSPGGPRRGVVVGQEMDHGRTTTVARP